MVIYFSGTGNSKFVSEIMANRLNDTVISANEYIKSGKSGDFNYKERFVFVAPIYVFAPPTVFYDFLKASSFSGAKKVWFVMTGAGKESASEIFYKKLCDKKGLTYMGTEHIVMPQNYIVYFKIKGKSENAKTVKDAIPEAEKLADIIKCESPFKEKKVSKAVYAVTKLTVKPYFKFFAKAKSFKTSDNCILCGKCEKLCPLSNIKLQNGRIEWGKNCTHCMACINLCPAKAIEYGKKTENKPRYNINNLDI